MITVAPYMIMKYGHDTLRLVLFVGINFSDLRK